MDFNYTTNEVVALERTAEEFLTIEKPKPATSSLVFTVYFKVSKMMT